jgi:pimeloyl-ACP methyl ester carboxylesterase
VQPVVINIGGVGPPLLFAHANGYPPGSYKQLFGHLSSHFSISAVEHRPLWGERTPPRRLHWQLFVRDFLSTMAVHYDTPVWVIGHSMGGTIAALAAAQEPQRFAGLILLDPVFLPDRLVFATRLMPEKKRRQLPMIRKALSRPEQFDSHESAFAFYRAKRAFQRLSDEALQDYIDASKAPRAKGGVELRYPREWEAAVYGSAPRIRGAIRRLRMPTLGLRGRDSDTLRHEMVERWLHWQPGVCLQEVPGGHLFPLEHPQETAEAVCEFVFPR